MNSLQRLVALVTVAALAAVVLFMPRNVPFGNKYPFVFGNSLALKASIDMQMLLIEVVAVIVIGGGLYTILGKMR
ncbi:MAG TPA: hypothetical protein VF678_08480 [bacterium]